MIREYKTGAFKIADKKYKEKLKAKCNGIENIFKHRYTNGLRTFKFKNQKIKNLVNGLISTFIWVFA